MKEIIATTEKGEIADPRREMAAHSAIARKSLKARRNG
jgi:hypothetical protein